MRGNDLTGMIHDRLDPAGIMPEPDIRTGLQRGHTSIMIASRAFPEARGFLTRTLCALALAGGGAVGFAQAASAQFAFDDAVLPPRVVAWRLADRGFSGMTRPRYDGRVYVVEAIDPAGIPVRLFLDPAGGAIVGRQRLGEPDRYARQDYARLERAAPGYGWTEEESGPRRALRLLPPQDPSASPPRPARRPGAEAARLDANPQGINPDGGVRPEPQRKVTRAVPPARQPELKPALRTTPEAPAPKLPPVEAARPEAKPEAPAAAVDKPAIDKATIEKSTPAEGSNKPAVAGEGARAEAAKAAVPDWKDPPTEGKRPVRVIEGATVVPGTSENKDAAQ